MAKWVSSLVDSLRGSIGDRTFAMWKGIGIVKGKAPVITNPNSSEQQVIRGLMATITSIWQGLTGPQKFSWNEMATRIKDYPMPPGGINNLIPGLGGPMSGFNCYVGFYFATFLTQGLSAPAVAPVSEDRPAPPVMGTPTYDNLTHTLTVPWTDPSAADVGAYIRLWARGQRDRLWHRQYVSSAALGVQTLAVTQLKSANGSFLTFENAEPTRVQVQLDTVNPSGFRSAPSAPFSIAIE